MIRKYSLFLLLILSVFSHSALAVFGNNNALTISNNGNEFVPVNQAFPFNSFQQGSHLFIDWQVKDGYYLYQDRISITAENVTLGEYQLVDGEPYHDEFFGDVNIYTTPLSIELPLSDYQLGARIIVQYQGCAKAGFCYPPENRVIEISKFEFSDPVKPLSTSTPVVSPSKVPESQQDSLAADLAQNWWTPILFLALGSTFLYQSSESSTSFTVSFPLHSFTSLPNLPLLLLFP